MLNVARAVRIGDLCRRLGKSRKQVYRYLRVGALRTAEKVLGEWLVDEAGAEHLAGRWRTLDGRLPPGSRPLFPEYRFRDLHAIRDASIVVPRLLEQGTLAEMNWVMRRYPREWLGRWMAREGWKLSPRSARFWSWWLRVPMPPPRQLPPAGPIRP